MISVYFLKIEINFAIAKINSRVSVLIKVGKTTVLVSSSIFSSHRYFFVTWHFFFTPGHRKYSSRKTKKVRQVFRTPSRHDFCVLSAVQYYVTRLLGPWKRCTCIVLISSAPTWKRHEKVRFKTISFPSSSR